MAFINAGPVRAADVVALTVIGVEELAWRGVNNSLNHDDSLGPDPNWPGGLDVESKRVFPDARMVSGAVTNARDTVELEVTLSVKPVEPVMLYVKAFDVDDPTAENDEVDSDFGQGALADDNRGSPKTGSFLGGADITFTPMDQTAARLFRVTMQPGDNFRVMASHDVASMNRFENTDFGFGVGAAADRHRIVDPGVAPGSGATWAQREVREAGKYCSPVLTVWRFLHVEVDSMGPVTGNYIDGNIVDLDTGNSGSATRVYVDVNLADGSPDLDTGFGLGRFDFGDVTIAGTHTIQHVDGNGSDFFQRGFGFDVCRELLPFDATGQPLQPGGPPVNMSGFVAGIINHTTLALTGIVSSPSPIPWGAFVGGTFSINGGPALGITMVDGELSRIVVDHLAIPFRAVDDDPGDGTTVPRPDGSRLAAAFAPAYVLPRESVLPGDENNTPFLANIADLAGVSAARAGWSFTNQSIHDLERFWVVYVRGALQSDTRLDRDPNSEGIVWGRADGLGPSPGPSISQGANIYYEAHLESDRQALPAPNLPGRGYLIPDTVVHEIGHLFGCIHQHGGIMGDDVVGPFDSADFHPISLRAPIRMNPGGRGHR